MLQLNNISKSYGGGQTVLNQVSFTLPPADFLYVLGGSGAGKSSLLRILSTWEPPTEGTVSWFGYERGALTQKSMERIRQRISVIPQKLDLIQDLSVLDNLKAGTWALPPSAIISNTDAKEILAKLALDKLLGKRIQQLSGGEAQRVAIARALFRKPELILGDEPTGSQDIDMTWKIMDLFVKQQLSGTSVILATHDLDMVKRLRKRCAVLKDGVFRIEGER